MDFCPICRGAEFAFKTVSDSYEIQCDTCGYYTVSSTLVATGFDDPKPLLALQIFIQHENAGGLSNNTSFLRMLADAGHIKLG
jgi:hypothetical protein